jgi:hypothetical protein
MEGMIGRQKRLLAVEDRRIGAGEIVEAVDLAGAERELDAATQCRVWVGLEIGINEVRNLARLAIQLDQVGLVDFASVGASALPRRHPLNWYSVNSALLRNWQVVKDWSEIARYRRKTRLEAEKLYQAVTDTANGVLAWIRNHW